MKLCMTGSFVLFLLVSSCPGLATGAWKPGAWTFCECWFIPSYFCKIPDSSTSTHHHIQYPISVTIVAQLFFWLRTQSMLPHHLLMGKGKGKKRSIGDSPETQQVPNTTTHKCLSDTDKVVFGYWVQPLETQQQQPGDPGYHYKGASADFHFASSTEVIPSIDVPVRPDDVITPSTRPVDRERIQQYWQRGNPGAAIGRLLLEEKADPAGGTSDDDDIWQTLDGGARDPAR